MSKDKRVLKNQEVIKAIHSFLIHVKENPCIYQDDKKRLIKLLKSQGGLSKYENEDFGIEKTSLNTLKRISPNVIDGGFEELNRCRIKALEALKNNKDKPSVSNKTSKSGLELTVRELENKIQQLQEAQLILIQGVSKGINSLQQIEKTKDLNRCNKLAEISRKELLSILSCSHNNDSNKVVNIKEVKLNEKSNG
tara:strand:+ start:17389 stop:17973 length:585 start_codon:yes stop_codon:yes gene_type:complete